MLTKLTIRNFKLFDEVELELGDRVVLVGPNNAGKTSALQALALWNLGAKRWSENRDGCVAARYAQSRPGSCFTPIPVSTEHRRRATQEIFARAGSYPQAPSA